MPSCAPQLQGQQQRKRMYSISHMHIRLTGLTLQQNIVRHAFKPWCAELIFSPVVLAPHSGGDQIAFSQGWNTLDRGPACYNSGELQQICNLVHLFGASVWRCAPLAKGVCSAHGVPVMQCAHTECYNITHC